ncbi:MAG: TIGR03915 family putative DNA repair protein [Pirellulales bacterium]
MAAKARVCLAGDVDPASVRWRSPDEPTSLFENDDGIPSGTGRRTASRVPPAFLETAKTVSAHRSADRWNLLYRLLWRLTHGEPRLLELAVDDDVVALHTLEKAVRRDAHKAKAFVRFHKTTIDGEERFLAWHKADHRILKIVAPFFSRRFGDMRWTIFTPWESVAWDLRTLHYGPGAAFDHAPIEDELAAAWKTYYASIFNPARLKVDTMRREMPTRYWGTMPETALIPDLIAGARGREQAFTTTSQNTKTTALDFFPADGATTIEALPRGGVRLPGLSHPRAGHANRLRRRSARRALGVRRRTTGRSRGSPRASVRRTGGATVRADSSRVRHRARGRLSDQHR